LLVKVGDNRTGTDVITWLWKLPFEDITVCSTLSFWIPKNIEDAKGVVIFTV